MDLYRIGHQIRQRRQILALTQAELARSAGLSRETINQLENGAAPDLGVIKLNHLLARLGLRLAMGDVPCRPTQDFVAMACTSASVSFRDVLQPDELARAISTGRAPTGRRPHLRKVFDEASPALLGKLVAQVAGPRGAERLMPRLHRLAAEVGSVERLA